MPSWRFTKSSPGSPLRRAGETTWLFTLEFGALERDLALAADAAPEETVYGNAPSR